MDLELRPGRWRSSLEADYFLEWVFLWVARLVAPGQSAPLGRDFRFHGAKLLRAAAGGRRMDPPGRESVRPRLIERSTATMAPTSPALRGTDQTETDQDLERLPLAQTVPGEVAGFETLDGPLRLGTLDVRRPAKTAGATTREAMG